MMGGIDCTLANQINSPGIYLIAPSKVRRLRDLISDHQGLIYVGMTHSLGLKKRTVQYEDRKPGSLKLQAVYSE